MTQFVKPIADKLHTGWTGNNVGGSNLYQEVDETVASTDDFTSYDVTNNVAGNSDAPVIVWKVTSVTTPASGTATIRFRTYASQTGTYFLEIRSGYVDESNKGTLLGTSSTQSHPGGGVFATLTDSAVSYAGGGDGTDLYFRLVGHNTSGSTNTMAVTALDADLPNADTTRNLSGTPDILVTTPITGSGTLTCSWSLSGTPDALATTPITGSGTMTVTQGSHTLTDGAPQLTSITGDGSGRAAWVLTGAPFLTAITGTGQGGLGPAHLSGDVNLLPYFVFHGLGIKFVTTNFATWDAAWDRALSIYQEAKRILFSVTQIAHGFQLKDYMEFEGQTAYEIRQLSKPALEDLAALKPDESQTYDRGTGEPAYTFVQPEQDNSALRPAPAADPVNVDGVVTYRPSLKSRTLRTRHE